jgi:hypothetical protein
MLAAMLLLLGQLMTRADLAIGDPGSTSGISISMAWDASPDTTVAGYYIAYGLSSDSCTNELDAGNATSATLSGLEEGVTYYFVVIAYDGNGLESPPSNEIVYVAQTPPPATPITLQIQNTSTAGLNISFNAPTDGTYQIQATQDFQSWETLSTTNAVAGPVTFPLPDPTVYAQRFYRMVKN